MNHIYYWQTNAFTWSAVAVYPSLEWKCYCHHRIDCDLNHWNWTILSLFVIWIRFIAVRFLQVSPRRVACSTWSLILNRCSRRPFYKFLVLWWGSEALQSHFLLPIPFLLRIPSHTMLHKCMFVTHTSHEDEMNPLSQRREQAVSQKDQWQQLTSSPRIIAFLTCSLVKPKGDLWSLVR